MPACLCDVRAVVCWGSWRWRTVNPPACRQRAPHSQALHPAAHLGGDARLLRVQLLLQLLHPAGLALAVRLVPLQELDGADGARQGRHLGSALELLGGSQARLVLGPVQVQLLFEGLKDILHLLPGGGGGKVCK